MPLFHRPRANTCANSLSLIARLRRVFQPAAEDEVLLAGVREEPLAVPRPSKLLFAEDHLSSPDGGAIDRTEVLVDFEDGAPRKSALQQVQEKDLELQLGDWGRLLLAELRE